MYLYDFIAVYVSEKLHSDPSSSRKKTPNIVGNIRKRKFYAQ